MIVHIVFFKLKNYPEGLIELKENLENLKGKIKEIKNFEIGEDFSRGDRSYDLSLYSSFETEEDLKKYGVHEEHVKVIDNYIKKYCDHTKIVDYYQSNNKDQKN